jgi:hypothetical protein
MNLIIGVFNVFNFMVREMCGLFEIFLSGVEDNLMLRVILCNKRMNILEEI